MSREDLYAQERHHMVLYQLASRGIKNSAVLTAMEKVPRHHFVPAALQHIAYSDSPLPIGEEQTISQPYIVALMAEYANITPQGRLLEIGTGSGYSAAVLAEMCTTVYTVERLASLSLTAQRHLQELGYTNISCLVGDGTLGWPDHAPYDSIIVTAGAPAVPETLRSQLAIGGTLIIPVGDSTLQHLIKIYRHSADKYTEQQIEAVRFVPLIGKEGWH